MRISSWLCASIVLLLGIISVSQPVSAQSIGINIQMPNCWGGWNYHANLYQSDEHRAGYVLQDNWNQLNRQGADPDLDLSGATSYSLIDSTGADISTTVAVTGSFTYGFTNNVDNKTGTSYGSHDLNAVETNQVRLYNGFIGNNSGTASNIFSLSDIPYDTYDVIVYPSSSNGRTGSLQLNGTGDTYYYSSLDSYYAKDLLTNWEEPWVVGTSTTAGEYSPANVIVFEGVSGSTLDIYHEAISGNSGIGGIQIIGPPTADLTLAMEVNRDTGEITLLNNTDADVSLAGLSVFSDFSSLVPGNWTSITSDYDEGATGGISPDEWQVILSSETELAEGTLGSNGATLAVGESISLGNIWVQSPFEDIEFEYLLADVNETITGGVTYIGENGRVRPGDYDGNGIIDELDWPTQRDNFGADLSGLNTVVAYMMGDIDFDGDNDLADLNAFKTAFLAAGGSLSALTGATTVPEPSTMVLLSLVGVAAVGYRFRRAVPQALALLVAAVTLLASSQAMALSIGVNFNRNNDEVFAAGTSAGAFPQVNWNQTTPDNAGDVGETLADLVDNFGVSTTASVTFSAANTWAQGGANTADGNISLLKGYLDDGGSGSNVQVTGIPYATYDLYLYGMGDGSQGTVLSDYSVTSGASVYDLSWVRAANLAAGESPIEGAAGVEGHYVKVSGLTSSDLTITGIRGSGARAPLAGFQIVDPAYSPITLLTLQIDPDTGKGRIVNSAGGPLSLDFYQIGSGTSGSLTKDTWQSIQDTGSGGLPQGDGTGNGWEELGNLSDNLLAEYYLSGTTSLSDGSVVSLGTIFDATSGVQGDITFEYAAGTSTMITGRVEFVSLPAGLAGDYNDDGRVDIADYVVWRNYLGAADESGLNGNGDGGGVTVSDYTYWKANFGSSAASSAVASVAVPEPATALVALLGIAGVVVVRRGRALSVVKSLALLVLCGFVAGNTAKATVTNDRLYLFGEGAYENASAGAFVGSGHSYEGDTLDEVGPTGAYLDLIQTGDPTYVNVNSGTYARPGTTSGDLGILLDGVDDSLNGIALNRPDELADQVDLSDDGTVNDSLIYPIDYTGITGRGIQMWVYPFASAIGSPESPTTFQSIVSDTLSSGGPAIDENGYWSQINSVHIGVSPTVEAVGDTWYHVMHHNFVLADPDVDGNVQALSVLYVDGQAVSANDDVIFAGYSGDLVVGAHDGGEATYEYFFNGVVDNLEMYVYGDNETGTPGDLTDGEDWGTFNYWTDNEWVADWMATNHPSIAGGVPMVGDVDMDNDVDDDDALALVSNWRDQTNVFDGAHVLSPAGDYLSWQKGDLNMDGEIDFTDWWILRDAHPAGASLNLGELFASVSVPEPGSVVLMLGATCLLVGFRRRNA